MFTEIKKLVDKFYKSKKRENKIQFSIKIKIER